MRFARPPSLRPPVGSWKFKSRSAAVDPGPQQQMSSSPPFSSPRKSQTNNTNMPPPPFWEPKTVCGRDVCSTPTTHPPHYGDGFLTTFDMSRRTNVYISCATLIVDDDDDRGACFGPCPYDRLQVCRGKKISPTTPRPSPSYVAYATPPIATPWNTPTPCATIVGSDSTHYITLMFCKVPREGYFPQGYIYHCRRYCCCYHRNLLYILQHI